MDPNCCMDNGGCSDGYLHTTGPVCGMTDGALAHYTECTPRTHTANDYSKCREWGQPDRECCAMPADATCADGYQLTVTEDVCQTFINNVTANSYTCTKPFTGLEINDDCTNPDFTCDSKDLGAAPLCCGHAMPVDDGG